ncbi:MAG: sigma-E processing peptidase SpoIIGA [Agathobacter sp.]|nr:sigma-E processing peptidase SpoIIGA [Agathobacter sp.]
MNILSKTYIFYADVYFIQNFIIRIAVLYLSLYCNKCHFHLSTAKGIGKIVLASAIGTLIEIAGLILGNSYNIFLILVHIFEIPLMLLLVLGKERKQIWKVILSGYFFIMVINGVLEWLWNWFGLNTSFTLLLLFACGVVIIVVRIWKNYNKMKKGIFLVELQQNDTRISTYGFYDSGNCLKEPYTQKGVHIVSKQLIKRLGLEKDTSVLIPYQALGKEDGILEVYYVDELIVEGEKGRKMIQKCPVGVTKDNLFEGKKYEMILNEEVF